MKYELTDETIEVKGHTLKRVRYLDTKKLGGYIESEKNLSQEGDARVYGNAQVSDNACVYGNARVYGNAQVSDNAQVYDYAKVSGNAKVCGNAQVFGNARVYDNAEIFDYAWVFDYAQVFGSARVFDYAWVYGDAHVYRESRISGSSRVRNGSWDKSPLQIQGSRFFFNVAGPNEITVGCHTFTVDKWAKVYKQEFEEHGLTKERQTEYISYFNKASKLYNFGVMLPLPEND